jgi:hypothetical protein
MPACLISTIQVHPARCCLDCHPVFTQTVVFASCDRLCASACLSLRLAAVKLVPRFGNIREGGMSSRAQFQVSTVCLHNTMQSIRTLRGARGLLRHVRARTYATTSSSSTDLYDVVIVGGGPAGLSLASSLRISPGTVRTGWDEC